MLPLLLCVSQTAGYTFVFPRRYTQALYTFSSTMHMRIDQLSASSRAAVQPTESTRLSKRRTIEQHEQNAHPRRACYITFASECRIAHSVSTHRRRRPTIVPIVLYEGEHPLQWGEGRQKLPLPVESLLKALQRKREEEGPTVIIVSPVRN